MGCKAKRQRNYRWDEQCHANPVPLIHHGATTPLAATRQIQVGPQITDGPSSLRLTELSMTELRNALRRRGWLQSALLQYTDPFSALPRCGHRQWPGPRLLACGDSHHGPDPIGSPQQYCAAEPHDAVLLTFNPALEGATAVADAGALPSPKRFRYPVATPSPTPRLELPHVGSLDPITLAAVNWWRPYLDDDKFPSVTPPPQMPKKQPSSTPTCLGAECAEPGP